MPKAFKNFAAAAVFALSITAEQTPAFANVVEYKILQYAGPELTVTCGKWASGKWPWPAKGGWKTCVSPTTHWKNHAFFLVVDGPDASEAVKKMLETALASSAIACTAAAAALPSPEPSLRAAACFAAAKVTFGATLSADALTSQYSLNLDSRGWW